MKAIFLKSSTVIAVSYLTWILTSSVVAQYAKKPSAVAQYAKKPSARPTGYKMGMQNIDNNLEPIPAAAGRGALATGSITKFHVSPGDGVAVVSATASLKDRRKGMNYIWHLTVATPDRQTLARQVYAHQVFSVPLAGIFEPTFHDTIVVPPGESIVELTLFAFAKGTNLKFLDDAVTAQGYESARAWRKVVN